MINTASTGSAPRESVKRPSRDQAMIGKTIRINRLSYTVRRVAPQDFHGTERWYWPEIWVPMMMEPEIETGDAWLNNRATWDTWIMGRLKAHTSPSQAEANLNTIATELARQYPRYDARLQFRLTKLGSAH